MVVREERRAEVVACLACCCWSCFCACARVRRVTEGSGLDLTERRPESAAAVGAELGRGSVNGQISWAEVGLAGPSSGVHQPPEGGEGLG